MKPHPYALATLLLCVIAPIASSAITYHNVNRQPRVGIDNRQRSYVHPAGWRQRYLSSAISMYNTNDAGFSSAKASFVALTTEDKIKHTADCYLRTGLGTPGTYLSSNNLIEASFTLEEETTFELNYTVTDNSFDEFTEFDLYILKSDRSGVLWSFKRTYQRRFRRIAHVKDVESAGWADARIGADDERQVSVDGEIRRLPGNRGAPDEHRRQWIREVVHPQTARIEIGDRRGEEVAFGDLDRRCLVIEIRDRMGRLRIADIDDGESRGGVEKIVDHDEIPKYSRRVEIGGRAEQYRFGWRVGVKYSNPVSVFEV